MFKFKVSRALVFVGVAILFSFELIAAPCCTSSSSIPSLMTGDEKFLLSSDFSAGYIVGDVSAHGRPIFRSSDDQEIEGSTTFSFAFLLSDRWQVGAQLPLKYRSVSDSAGDESRQGFGDMRIHFAYEVLPEWNYSRWKPKGFFYFDQIFPTGNSIYESSSNSAFGKGFFSSGFGVIFLKSWSRWDASVASDAHYSFSRTFSNDLTIEPGWSASSQLAAGWSFKSLRLGAKYGPNYQQPKKSIDASNRTSISYQLVWNAGLDFSYLMNEKFTTVLGYNDQTIFGPTKNTTLSRTVSAGIQYRLGR